MKLFIDIGIIVITVLMMLTVGLDLKRKSLSALLKNRASVTFLLLCHLVIPPLVGIIIVLLIPMRAELAAAILLLAACPIGDIANLYTIMARGNPALSLTLNAITCLLAPLSMLLVFAVLNVIGLEHTFLAVPASTLLGRLALFLFLPVTIGALIAFKMHNVGCLIRPFLHRFVGIGILMMLSVIIYSQWETVKQNGLPFALTCFAFMTGCLSCGLVCNRFLRLPPSSAHASLLCFPVRNVGVASLIAITLLGRIDYASVAAVYFIVEVPLLLLLVWILRSGFITRDSSKSKMLKLNPRS
ncbi:MAG: BASS family bile acid:Na+ symporter [Cryomorphaceae bacterium]